MPRKLIHMALRRVREGTGSYHAGPKDQWNQQAPDMKTLLGGVPYLIIGGLATRLYMPERMTLDIDVLIFEKDRESAEENLRKNQAGYQGELSIGGSSWILPGGKACDLIALREHWVEDAMVAARVGRDGQPYIDLPWLVLLKLLSSRTQDLADISRMLGRANESDLNRVRTVIGEYRPEDMEDLESLIKLGKMEA